MWNHILASRITKRFGDKYPLLSIIAIPIISIVANNFINSCCSLASDLSQKLKDRWNSKTSEYAACLIYSGHYSTDIVTKHKLNEGLKAYMHYIFSGIYSEEGLMVEGIKRVKSMDVENSFGSDIYQSFMIQQEEPIVLPNNIIVYCKVTQKEEHKIISTQYTIETYYDEYRDKTKNMNQLMHLYQTEILPKYLDYVAKKRDVDTQYAFMLREGTIILDRYAMTEEPRQFDHIYFPGKEEFLRNLDHFVENRESYKAKGKSYRKVILAHGEPGCGKTSMLRALANRLKSKDGKYLKHLIHLNLNKLTRRRLFHILHTERLKVTTSYDDDRSSASSRIDFEMVSIPFDRRIYYIEEIDCYDVTHKRKVVEEQKKKKEEEEEEARRRGYRMQERKEEEEEKSITIGDLLEALDGIPSMKNGEILFMTTNHIELIDPALLRAGRVNHLIKFEASTKECTITQLEKYFDTKLTSEQTEYIPNKVFTGAKIEAMCERARTVDGVLEIMKSNWSEENNNT